MSRCPVTLAALALVCSAPFPAQAGDTRTVAAFDPEDVRLLESPFLEAARRNAAWLLSLDADRLLHNTRKYAGLEPKGERYGGWESRGIAGHTLGHYLTALSQEYAAGGDRRFRQRIDYIVSEMAQAQQAYGDGYVGALPPRELATLRALAQGTVEPENPFVFAGGAWVPWYTQHKVLAGLRDAWVVAGNRQARAVALELADWVERVTANLDEEGLQRMLEVEHGGMHELLMDLHALTGEDRYLDAAGRFRHDAILEPLLAGRDELAGLHANTQIPKIAGAARSFEVTGRTSDRRIAERFWQLVTGRHGWVIGGNSEGEHFFQPSEASSRLTAATAETCNTYNMLKLTEYLIAWRPRVEYADYYERALYNHILASQEPERGMFAYFVSLKPGHFRTYSSPEHSFWCCVGSGMENHTRYGRAIYFSAGSNGLYVNLFVPSVLTWRERNFVLEQRTEYPRDNRVSLVVRAADDRPLALSVRAPSWAAGDLALELNGKTLPADGSPGGYATIERRWQEGDELSVVIPMAVRTEPLAGDPDQVAFLYGPVVLAGDLGAVPRSDTIPYAEDQSANLEAAAVDVPVLLAEPERPAAALHRLSGEALAFRVPGQRGGKRVAVTLRPFAELHYRYHNVYWRVAGARRDPVTEIAEGA